MTKANPAPAQSAAGPEVVSRDALELRASTYNEEERTVDALISKGSAVRRWWGTEKLEISEQAVDLTRVRSGLVNLLDTHNRWGIGAVLGRVTDAWIRNGELWARFKFADTDAGREAEGMVSRGEVRGVSVGYSIHSFQVDKADGEKDETRTAVKWELMEVSLVPVPADPESGIRSAPDTSTRSKGHGAATSKENAMETPNNGGGAPAPETRTETATTPTPTPAASTPAPAPAPSEPVSQRQHPEFTATAALSFVSMARSFGAEMGTRAEALVNEVGEDKISPDMARSTLLAEAASAQDTNTAGISNARTQITTDATDKFIRGAGNAILVKAGLSRTLRRAAEKTGDEIDLDPGEFAGMRMTDLATVALELEGETVRTRNPQELIAMALSSTAMQGRSVMQSSSTFAVLLENTMHKTIQAAYAVTPDTWRRWCGVGSVRDFRPHPRIQRGSFGKLDELTETGEFKNKKIPDGVKELISAKTKGNIIALSRQSMVNDDLDAFSTLATELARAAGLSVEIDAYALLETNPEMNDGTPLFDADHSNLAASGGAPSVASFDAARVAMASQKDISENEVLDIRPSVWLGPIGLGGDARVINDAVYDPDTPNKIQKPNKVRGQFADIVDTARLTGNAWYAFADPDFNPAVEVVFLDGVETPFLEMQDGFRTDGIEWKVRHDYGVGALNHRSAYRNPGA